MSDHSVRIALNVQGFLELVLADDRRLALREDDASLSETIRRILRGLAAQQDAIGLDGAPTKAQAQHWQSHNVFPRDNCPFCLKERLGLDPGIKRHSRRRELRPGSRVDGVVIRKVLTTSSALRGKTSTQATSEECGL